MPIISTIDNAEITRLQLDLLLFRKEAGKNFNHRVTRRFEKRRAGKILKDGIREKHNIKAKDVYDRISATATGKRFTGGIQIRARRKQTGIEHWQTTPARPSPPRRIGSLKIKSRKNRQGIANKVFSGYNQQKTDVFFWQRLGTKPLPIKRIIGPSLFHMYMRNNQKIDKQFESGFIEEAIKAIKFIKRKRARR